MLRDMHFVNVMNQFLTQGDFVYLINMLRDNEWRADSEIAENCRRRLDQMFLLRSIDVRQSNEKKTAAFYHRLLMENIDEKIFFFEDMEKAWMIELLDRWCKTEYGKPPRTQTVDPDRRLEYMRGRFAALKQELGSSERYDLGYYAWLEEDRMSRVIERMLRKEPDIVGIDPEALRAFDRYLNGFEGLGDHGSFYLSDYDETTLNRSLILWLSLLKLRQDVREYLTFPEMLITFQQAANKELLAAGFAPINYCGNIMDVYVAFSAYMEINDIKRYEDVFYWDRMSDALYAEEMWLLYEQYGNLSYNKMEDIFEKQRKANRMEWIRKNKAELQ